MDPKKPSEDPGNAVQHEPVADPKVESSGVPEGSGVPQASEAGEPAQTPLFEDLQPIVRPKEDEKPAKKKPPKEIWKISGFEKRCQQFVADGALIKDGGVDELVKSVNEEFAEKLEAAGAHLTKKALLKRMQNLVWTTSVVTALKNAIRHGYSLEDFRTKFYPYIPEKMLLAKARRLRGLSKATDSAKFKAGMGRFSTEDLPAGAEAFEFPKTSFKEPYVVSAGPEWQIPVVNGALIGIAYDPDIKNNDMRRALADAKKRDAAAVVLTNPFVIDTKKTGGPLKVYRAMASGIQMNPERFPAEYREEVERILRDKPSDELIYQTIAEKFQEILDGLYKITHRPDGSPEFDGPVIYPLGYIEEEVIAAATYHECRYLTILKQKEIEAELGMAKSRLSEAMDEEDEDDIEHWSSEVDRLTQQRARTIITNIGDPQYEFHRRRMRALVVGKLESAIPNCKVVSQGSVYLKVGDKVIKIHIPGHDDVTDGLLAQYGDVYGMAVFTDTLADVTVICHPHALNHRFIGREDSKDGQPVTKFVHVAPICVDYAFLDDVFRDTTKSVHPISKVIREAQFKPGVLILSSVDGIVSADALPIPKLDRAAKAVRNASNFAFPYPEAKYITWYLNTDNHFGSPAKRYIWDPKERIHLGVNEAAVEFFRRTEFLTPTDVGIHGIAEMDDATNGDLWFNPRYQPDPQEMSIIFFEGWLRRMTAESQRAAERGDLAAVQQINEDINRVSIGQLYFKGEDFPFHQMMQVYDRHVDPLTDLFSAVLGRFVKSGIVLKGISKINRNIIDTRDLGVINYPNGNHRIGTLERKDLEGEYFARKAQDKVGQLARWQKYLKDHPDFLKEAIRAPRFGNQTFGWGTMTAPGGFEWGIRVLGSPAKLSSWSDILAAVIRNDLARGDSSYGLLKHKTVTFFGDKHFYCKAETAHITYIMCAAGAHTDLYGDTGGFPPNNTGVCFASIPADGPDAGPIIVRALPHDFLRDWFANPKPFNWKKFLPNPV